MWLQEEIFSLSTAGRPLGVVPPFVGVMWVGSAAHTSYVFIQYKPPFSPLQKWFLPFGLYSLEGTETQCPKGFVESSCLFWVWCLCLASAEVIFVVLQTHWGVFPSEPLHVPVNTLTVQTLILTKRTPEKSHERFSNIMETGLLSWVYLLEAETIRKLIHSSSKIIFVVLGGSLLILVQFVFSVPIWVWVCI